jgi:hypothetical protein
MFLLSFIPDAFLIWAINTILIVGLIGTFSSFILRFIPPLIPYSSLLRIVGIVLLVVGVYFRGGYGVEMEWRAKVEEIKLEIAKKEKESAEVSQKVVTKYVETVKVVKEKGDVIIKEIPTFITKSDDDKCAVPNGFVSVHDAAAKNEIPETTRGTNEGTSEVKISGVAETVVENYTTYHQVAEQLKSLQNWIREQQKVYNK